MPNLRITSVSPYVRTMDKITVTGTASSGADVKVMIIPRPPSPISSQEQFDSKYNMVLTHDSMHPTTPVAGTGAVPVSPPAAAMGQGQGTLPPPQSSWTRDVSVTGLTAGTQYVIYASDGGGKLELQDPATFN